MKRKILFMFVDSLLAITQVFAEQKTVTSKVLDDDRLPLPAASVKIKGQQAGVVSASDGVYSIRVSAGQVLVFTYVGKVVQEYTVGTDNSHDVVLKTDASQL